MKILLVYPQYPDTFWSFKHALKFVYKKAAFPPLGLLTIASMLPQSWEKRLIDLNINDIKTSDIEWADYIFISAMTVQRESALKVIEKCKTLGKKVVAGGPLFTSEYERFTSVDHFILKEAEPVMSDFIHDLMENKANRVYKSDHFPDLSLTPLPQWDLIQKDKYSCLSIQYSRGCPFNCEFCDIVTLNGRIPRTKSKQQLINELEAVYHIGWRGSVFIVDDNFIGNKTKLKSEILPAIATWMQKKNYPFSLFTEASINLADDDELIRLMVDANFKMVFVGIETPDNDSLNECGKYQNQNRDLIQSISKLQKAGLQVQGGFIVGFDNDNISIFEKQIQFIQKSGIVTAMVGLLHAPPGTRLYKRLKSEKRITNDFTGNNTDFAINFKPKMDFNTLITGYHKIINTIYSPVHYYERIITFLKNYQPSKNRICLPNITEVIAFIKSVLVLGLLDKGKKYYWKLLFWTAFKKPKCFHLSITLSIYGFHFRKIVEKYNKLIVELENSSC